MTISTGVIATTLWLRAGECGPVPCVCLCLLIFHSICFFSPSSLDPPPLPCPFSSRCFFTCPHTSFLTRKAPRRGGSRPRPRLLQDQEILVAIKLSVSCRTTYRMDGGLFPLQPPWPASGGHCLGQVWKMLGSVCKLSVFGSQDPPAYKVTMP